MEEQDEIINEQPEQLEESREIDVEIVDDTPEEDRNRKPSREPIPDVTDDELDNYGEKVQERIRGLNRKFHDERRQREALSREREELATHTQRILEENRRLKQQLASGSEVFIAKSISEAEAQLAAAKREYREAHENGDTDKLVDAQEKMARAVTYLEESKRLKPLTVDQEEGYIPQVQVPNDVYVPKPSAAAEAWAEKNEWFGKDEVMTSLALGLHRSISQNVQVDSKEYYDRIDAGMRDAFPRYFNTERTNNEREEKPRTRPNVVVAPASRSHAEKKITLTKSQVAVAKRLGVPLEEYARQVAALDRLLREG